MRDDSDPTPADRFPGYDGLESAVLRRYVSGRSGAAERQRVEAWAAEAVERRRYLAAMRELFERGAAGAETTAETAAAWERIAARMEPPTPSTTATPDYVAPWEVPAVRVDVRRRQPPRILAGGFAEQRRWNRALLATAAALLLAIGGGTLLVRANLAPVLPAPVPTMRQIATTKGQRAEIQLGDGSRVVLGVASKLRFPVESGTGPLELYLEGTAYFDVAHDSTRPFLVHTATATAEDIGTRFVVTAYPETRSTQVVVTQGAVALGTRRSPAVSRVVLTEGRLGRLGAADSVPSVLAVDPALYTAWMRGELAFRDAPLADVVAELRRWYDVDVRLGDPALRDVPLTASFAAESFDDALAVVTTVLPVRTVRQGRTVVLYGR